MSRSIIEYRKAGAGDVQFILKSWIDSFKGAHGAGILSIPEFVIPQACKCGENIPVRYDFAAVMDVTLARLLQRPGCTAWVAHNPRERSPHDLYGFIVAETAPNVPTYIRGSDDSFELKVEAGTDPLVHFVFVKRVYRRLGIARALFKVAGVDPQGAYLYTCKTSNVSKLEKAGVMPKARWFPLSARFPKTK